MLRPIDSLNLAWAGGDDPDAMAENHRRVLADFAPGLPGSTAWPSSARCTAATWRSSVPTAGARRARPPARRRDALVTTQPGVSLMVRAADCVPVAARRRDGGVVGAAHAGRPGLVAGVVPATVAAMRDHGATEIDRLGRAARCAAAATRCPQEMRDEVAAVEPASRATTSWGTPSLDVGRRRARPARPRRASQIVDLSRCTRESPDLFSYRRDGRASGRPGRRSSGSTVMTDDVPPPRRRSPPASTPYDGRIAEAAGGGRARRRRRDPGRGDQVLPGRPTSGCWPSSASPTSARTATRRRPTSWPSAATSACAGTSSAGCRATRPPRVGVVRRRRRVGRPASSSSGRSSAAPTSAATTGRRACSR